MMRRIKDLDRGQLRETLQGWGFPAFHAAQILRWIYQEGAEAFGRMSDLPLALRRRLEGEFLLEGLQLEAKRLSADGTEKFLFALPDRHLIEAVSIPAEERVTGCVSSQAGCRFACAFCASGTQGFKRNLAVGEILDQVTFLRFRSRARALTHLVFMGMGEPLDNYDAVCAAIRMINSDDGPRIGARRITISTCGIIPGMERLAQEGWQVELSVSLHAADERTRTRLMPVNRRYPLAELIPACRQYAERTGRQITFEYALIKGVNSSLADARKLGTMLKGLDCKLNLIPLNAVMPGGPEPPNKLDVLFFRDALTKSGVRSTIRKSRGRDIEAACGQLRLRHEEKHVED